jgi:class 3 adenylate cyclase
MSQLVYERMKVALGILIAVKEDHQEEKRMPQIEQPKTLEEWAGSQHLSLGLVFTDIVESTAIGRKRGDDKWIDDLFLHFSLGRDIAGCFDSYVVKVIGDSLMVAFRTASDAVSFAINFSENTGVDYVGIRVGINSGDVEIRDNDIYGLNVNFTSRVQSALPGDGILVANSVKRDFEKRFGEDSGVDFIPREVILKSFGPETLYFVATPNLAKMRRDYWNTRSSLLGVRGPR